MALSAERKARLDRAIFVLECRDLDLYLEQRQLYRELVAECAHRGVPPPAKPAFYDVHKRAPVVAEPVVAEPVVAVRAQQPLVRSFAAANLVRSGERSISGLAAPFDVASTVSDPPGHEHYREVFRRGCFRDATREPSTVLLDFQHQTNLPGIVGYATKLEERHDGLWADFAILSHPDGAKAISLVEAGVLSGLSVAFKPLESKSASGVVERLRVHLDAVGLVRRPAHRGARVTAVRDRVR